MNIAKINKTMAAILASSILIMSSVYVSEATAVQVDSAKSAATEQKMRITYLVFSGRPNPTITIAPGRVYDVIERQLADARATGKVTSHDNPHPILGYSGIMLERIAADGKVSRHIVKGRLLQIQSDAGHSVTTTSTSAVGLEAALLSIGHSYDSLDKAVLDFIKG